MTSNIRELDSRNSNGIEVTLLWDSVSGETFVSVSDLTNDSEEMFPVAAADARDAFMHPYAYLTAVSERQYFRTAA
jgi:hypothetical protein